MCRRNAIAFRKYTFEKDLRQIISMCNGYFRVISFKFNILFYHSFFTSSCGTYRVSVAIVLHAF